MNGNIVLPKSVVTKQLFVQASKYLYFIFNIENDIVNVNNSKLFFTYPLTLLNGKKCKRFACGFIYYIVVVIS